MYKNHKQIFFTNFACFPLLFEMNVQLNLIIVTNTEIIQIRSRSNLDINDGIALLN